MHSSATDAIRHQRLFELLRQENLSRDTARRITDARALFPGFRKASSLTDWKSQALEPWKSAKP
ncbi:MAG: hypothetical protein ACU0BB_07835 [Paracoccaceae bacterium]|jgi:hypothetical protein